MSDTDELQKKAKRTKYVIDSLALALQGHEKDEKGYDLRNRDVNGYVDFIEVADAIRRSLGNLRLD